jgi:hypothetical protein
MPLSQQEIDRLSRRIRIQRMLVPGLFRKPNKHINDHLGLVFVHIPKTAGTSIRSTLAQLPNPKPRRYLRLKAHARAFEFRLAMGEQRWNDSFSFAVIRNPFDLMVSSYFWWLEKAGAWKSLREGQQEVQAMGGFGDFVRSELGREYINEYPGDIFDWIALDGEIIVDYVARMETLADDWREIMRRVDGPPIELPRENVTSRGDYRQYYDDETAELVARRFHRTLERFDYSF